VPHAEQEMLTVPEHPISSLVFIEVHVVLSFVSPFFMWQSCLMDFKFSLFLLFDCLVSRFFLLKSIKIATILTSLLSTIPFSTETSCHFLHICAKFGVTLFSCS